MQALRTASDQALTSGKSEPFEQAVRAGVSSNLCEAVVKMAGPVQPADEMVVAVTWARSRPSGPEAVGAVSLPGDRLPVIEEAYQRGATVTCSGELGREGTQFVLRNPREFTVSQEE